MFVNDGILSKRLVLILIRVYQQRSAWHCADTDFINNKKCKWKIWQDGEISEATASRNRSVNFQNVIEFELWLYSLLWKLVVHFTAVLTAIRREIYKLPVRNHITLHKNFDHKHFLDQQVRGFSRPSRSSSLLLSMVPWLYLSFICDGSGVCELGRVAVSAAWEADKERLLK